MTFYQESYRVCSMIVQQNLLRSHSICGLNIHSGGWFATPPHAHTSVSVPFFTNSPNWSFEPAPWRIPLWSATPEIPRHPMWLRI